MGILKRHKNKTFNYTPRYIRGDADTGAPEIKRRFDRKGGGSPFKIKHPFDDFRKTVGSNRGLKAKFNDALSELKSHPNKAVNNRIGIIVGILVLLFLFFIDFQVSIFFK